MKAQIILADPPWRYNTWSTNGQERSPDRHYSTMSIDALMALPVESIAAANCALFMWVCLPSLPEALSVGESWGFRYVSTAFVWAKMQRRKQRSLLPVENDIHWHIGLGHWTRANAELCLLFTRGNPKRINAGVRQLIVSPVRAHSQKPDEQYERIETLMGCLEPRVELFSRYTATGWYAFGNAISGRDIRDDLLEFAERE